MTEPEPVPASTEGGRARITGRVDRRILLRLRIYTAIFLAVAVLVVVDVVRAGPRSVLPVLAGLAVGVLVGILASRMFHLSWDSVSGRVVGRLDWVGGIVLVLYVLFSIFRTQLFDLWFDGAVLAAAALAALAGAMLGQVVGTGRGIGQVLRLVAGREKTDAG